MENTFLVAHGLQHLTEHEVITLETKFRVKKDLFFYLDARRKYLQSRCMQRLRTLLQRPC